MQYFTFKFKIMIVITTYLLLLKYMQKKKKMFNVTEKKFLGKTLLLNYEMIVFVLYYNYFMK